MLDQARQGDTGHGDYVDFLVTGMTAAGQYHCADCGYGVTVYATLPQCPMCSGTMWEPAAWTAVARTQRV
jgi:tRNA(Arg) A34 adenosine deaminase TadA